MIIIVIGGDWILKGFAGISLIGISVLFAGFMVVFISAILLIKYFIYSTSYGVKYEAF